MKGKKKGKRIKKGRKQRQKEGRTDRYEYAICFPQ
jgi:hypothetical protein